MKDEAALLELSDLQAGYGNIQVLKGVSMAIRRGEIVTLIGANGAGKSTTLRSISGLLLDEPSMGLAPLMVKEIFKVIRAINGQGVTVLLVEQNARQALQIAHRGYVIETGRIVMSDDASRLLTSDAIRKAYLGE